jgi:uncharacterized paraquat-inducible protein A
MDIVKIVFICSVIFPLITTIFVMWFVWASRKKIQEKKKAIAKSTELVSTLESVVESQDRVLELYRESQN